MFQPQLSRGGRLNRIDMGKTLPHCHRIVRHEGEKKLIFVKALGVFVRLARRPEDDDDDITAGSTRSSSNTVMYITISPRLIPLIPWIDPFFMAMCP